MLKSEAKTSTRQTPACGAERSADRAWEFRSPIRHLPAEEVLIALGSALKTGLAEKVVLSRQRQCGFNEIAREKTTGITGIILRQFQSSVVLLLGIATIVSLVMQEYLQAVGIVVVLLINAALGAITEHRAQTSLDALMHLSGTTARVRRSGAEQSVPVRELVPGDIILLSPGERVPADIRLIECASLSADESAISGESTPVYKDGLFVEGDDDSTMLFQGTLVLSGRGVGVITATAKNATLGKLGKLVQTVSTKTTPLEQQLSFIGDDLTRLTVVVCSIVGLVGILHHEPALKMLETSVTLAVAAIPEALPLIATLAMALGIARMIRERALIRKLPAIETLGSTTVICTDKTGTLTENKMLVSSVVLPQHKINFSGSGYEPIGDLTEDGKEVSSQVHRDVETLLTAAALCNDATLEMHDESNGWHIHGDPTEGALLTAAAKIGLSQPELEQTYPRLGEVPFDLARKRMSTIHAALSEGSSSLFLKGAPEVVLMHCSSVLDEGTEQTLTHARKLHFLRENERLAAQGLRVLAIAAKQLSGAQWSGAPSAEMETDLTLLGLVGISDRPRDQVKEAIAKCHRAGVRVLMLTGDQVSTATAIARELGIISSDPSAHAINAEHLDRSTDSEIQQLLKQARVLARLAPESKLRVVQLLQQSGEVVAMTGDGVNDAPALKQADIGVAMGKEGSELARESASLVITDDNFNTIVKAVEHGRLTYDNIQRCVAYLLTASLTSVMVVTLGIITDTGLMMKPMQLLCLNLIMHVFPALGLVIQTYDRGLMQLPPRPRAEKILARRQVIQIVFRSTLISTLTLACVLTGGFEPPHATTAVLACTSVNLIAQSWLWLPRPTQVVKAFNIAMIGCSSIALAILAAGLYWRPLNVALSTVPPTLHELQIIGLVTLLATGVTWLFGRRRQ